MGRERLRFIHISDTHIGPTPGFELFGAAPYERAQVLIEVINRLPMQPDFVLHTGDVLADPDPGAFRLAEDVFRRSKFPVYFVNGNHDSNDEIRQLLGGRAVEFLGPSERAAYSFRSKGVTVLCLDAKGPPENEPHGTLPPDQLEATDRLLASATGRVVVTIHFPPFDLDCEWLNQKMLLTNGSEFHAMLVPHADKIAGVFFGHIHRGLQVLKDGILYCSVGSSFCCFGVFPGEAVPRFQPAAPGRFNVVTVGAESVLVREYTVDDFEG